MLRVVLLLVTAGSFGIGLSAFSFYSGLMWAWHVRGVACTYGIGESLECCTCLDGFIVLLLEHLPQLIVLQSTKDNRLDSDYIL